MSLRCILLFFYLFNDVETYLFRTTQPHVLDIITKSSTVAPPIAPVEPDVLVLSPEPKPEPDPNTQVQSEVEDKWGLMDLRIREGLEGLGGGKVQVINISDKYFHCC